jgi:hypothetical protein
MEAMEIALSPVCWLSPCYKLIVLLGVTISNKQRDRPILREACRFVRGMTDNERSYRLLDILYAIQDSSFDIPHSMYSFHSLSVLMPPAEPLNQFRKQVDYNINN